MAGMSLKEKAMLGGVAVVGLYALTAVLWYMYFKKEFSNARKAHLQATVACAEEKAIIAEKDTWDEAYLDALAAIPEIPDTKRADAHMMEIVRKIAQAHNITFSGEKSSRETVADEMNRLTIELDWTGAFETLIGFLHELETTDKGKFDVSAINFSPMSKRPGYLSGKMTLTCIVRRTAT